MKIRKITLNHFRCYESADFSFNGNLTVIIGNNTTGKTTLLRALRIGLGAYLQSIPTLANGNQYRCNFTKEDRRQWFDEESKDYQESEEWPRISIEALFPFKSINSEDIFEEKQISWYRELTKGNNTTHNKECVGNLIDATSELFKKEAGYKTVKPLVLSFSTKRIDAQTKQADKVEERQKRIDKAYRASLRNGVDFESAMEWLKKYNDNQEDGKEFDGNREAFYTAISDAIPMLSQVKLHKGELEAIVEINGTRERHHFSFMSDGFKSIISLVSEVAYRAIMLNGYLGSDAVKQTPGIVLIDEIDLFLHPLWQKRILDDLQKAFPNIQFIVTTHSPFIVQSVTKDHLLVLDDVEVSEDEPNMKSIEDIAEEEMNMQGETRSKAYKRMLEAADEFFQIVSTSNGMNSEEIEQLRQRLAYLEAQVGNNPVYRALMEERMEANGLMKDCNETN